MEQGGLSHLMEAATALATLTDTNTAAAAAEASTNNAVATTTTAATSAKQQRSKQQHTSPTTNNKEIFPVRLMAILNDPTIADDIITWLPHGRSFVIVRPDVFTEQVLPLYMPPDTRSSSANSTTTKYPSFTRKLNRWGFRQATRGPDTGAFHHALFRRDNPALCLEMVCQRSRDARQKKLPAKKRKIAELTAASLEAMTTASAAPQQPITASARIATVSVSGESSSSSSSSDPPVATAQSSQPTQPRQGITADTQLAEQAVLQLNEQERLRTAKAMLYHAYLEAVQQQAPPQP